jgi:hypothetical protein
MDIDLRGARVAVDVRVAHGGRLVVLRDDDLPPPAPGSLDLRSHGLWLSLVDEGGGRWTVALEAFALAVDDPGDERGDLVPLGLDVEVEGGRLLGDLLIGDEVVPLDVPASWSDGR